MLLNRDNQLTIENETSIFIVNLGQSVNELAAKPLINDKSMSIYMRRSDKLISTLRNGL